MVDTNKLKGKIVEHKMSVDSVAVAIGVNPATLYRRMNDGSKFTVAEVGKIASLLSLTIAEINEIFFAVNVA